MRRLRKSTWMSLAVASSVALLASRCGKEKSGEQTGPQPTRITTTSQTATSTSAQGTQPPSSWDGLSDWSESAWQLIDE